MCVFLVSRHENGVRVPKVSSPLMTFSPGSGLSRVRVRRRGLLVRSRDIIRPWVLHKCRVLVLPGKTEVTGPTPFPGLATQK